MTMRAKRQRGQALLLVTLALLAMCGLLGLAVDLGWSYYVKKSAQAAADSAALAAVTFAKQNATPPYSTCDGSTSTTLYCNNTPTNCASIVASYPNSNVNSACLYALQNGFNDGVGNVKVTVAANTTTRAPTVPGVTVAYWVTVRVNQQIPQLFSAVLGNSSGLVSARATAALANVVFRTGLDLLNREYDPSAIGTGVNLSLSGGGSVQSSGGIYIASNLTAAQGGAAQFNGISGKGITNTPYSWFRDTGGCLQDGVDNCQGSWTQNWTNGHSDGLQFQDPTSLMQNPNQPPLSTSPVNTDRIVDTNTNKGRLGASNPTGVTGAGTANDPYVLPAGNYYAANCSGSGQCSATGGQIKFDNAYYCFGSCSSTAFAASNQWVFYGGLTTSGGNATITFSPGRYVFAGTTNRNPSFWVDNGTTIRDTYNGGAYPGEIFIYTNPNYASAAGNLSVPSALSDIVFSYGESGFKSGNSGGDSSFTLHGLDPANAPSDLQTWAPFLLWQDRGDSTVAYNPATGQIQAPVYGVCPPGSSAEAGSGPDVACSVTPPYPKAPQMNLQATNTNMQGAIYQPRGAWLNIQGGGNIANLQIITGALNVLGGGSVVLGDIATPITILATVLIE
jgi:Flp pilus assembly protein TadG